MVAKSTIRPITGSIQPQMVRCGKAGCRCTKGGPLHGPYYYRFYRLSGRQLKKYVRAADLEDMREATRQWKALRPPLSSIVTPLRELSILGKTLTKGV